MKLLVLQALIAGVIPVAGQVSHEAEALIQSSQFMQTSGSEALDNSRAAAELMSRAGTLTTLTKTQDEGQMQPVVSLIQSAMQHDMFADTSAQGTTDEGDVFCPKGETCTFGDVGVEIDAMDDGIYHIEVPGVVFNHLIMATANEKGTNKRAIFAYAEKGRACGEAAVLIAVPLPDADPPKGTKVEVDSNGFKVVVDKHSGEHDEILYDRKTMSLIMEERMPDGREEKDTCRRMTHQVKSQADEFKVAKDSVIHYISMAEFQKMVTEKMAAPQSLQCKQPPGTSLLSGMAAHADLENAVTSKSECENNCNLGEFGAAAFSGLFVACSAACVGSGPMVVPCVSGCLGLAGSAAQLFIDQQCWCLSADCKSHPEEQKNWCKDSEGCSHTCTGNSYNTNNDLLEAKWGGKCTCPDGKQYDVSDNGDACGSLQCEGGTAGPCEKTIMDSRSGKRVVCGRTSP